MTTTLFKRKKRLRSILIFFTAIIILPQKIDCYTHSNRREEEKTKNNIFIEEYIRENIKEPGVVTIGNSEIRPCAPILKENTFYYGTTTTTDSNNYFNFEVEYAFEIAVDNSLSDISAVLLSLEGDILEVLIPELFPNKCKKGGRGKRRRLDNEPPVPIIGISSSTNLPVVKSKECKLPNTNCFKVDDGFLIYTNAINIDDNKKVFLTNKIKNIISTKMRAGAFDNAHASIEQLIYIKTQLSDGKTKKNQIQSTVNNNNDNDDEDMTMTIVSAVVVSAVLFIVLAEIIRRRVKQAKCMGKVDKTVNEDDDASVQVERKLHDLCVDKGIGNKTNEEDEDKDKDKDDIECRMTVGTSVDHSGESLFHIAEEEEDEDDNSYDDYGVERNVEITSKSKEGSKRSLGIKQSAVSLKFGRSVRFDRVDEIVRFDDVKWDASKRSLEDSKNELDASFGQSFTSSGKVPWDTPNENENDDDDDAFKSGKGWNVSEWIFNSGRISDKTEPTLESGEDEFDTGSESGFKISKGHRPSLLLTKDGPSSKFDGVNESIKFSKGWDVSERTFKSIKSGMSKSMRSIKGRAKSERANRFDPIPLAQFDEQQFDDDFGSNPFGNS